LPNWVILGKFKLIQCWYYSKGHQNIYVLAMYFAEADISM